MGTETTDSMTKGMVALAAMETNAAWLSEVAARLLTEHAGHLPELLEIRAQATAEHARLALQPRTSDDARLWARALGVSVNVIVEDEGDGRRGEIAEAEFSLDGVSVRLGSYQSFSADQWAERIAAAVAA